MPRKRLNLSLPQPLYTQLQAIARRYGFGSACEMAATLLQVFATHTLRAEAEHQQRLRQRDEDNEAYIAALFDELAEAQPTPDGTVPVTHPRRQCQ